MINKTNWTGGGQEVRQRIERALDYHGGTADGADLLQTFINRTVQQLTLREFGLVTMLPKRSGSGDKAYINTRTASGGGAWVNDDPSTTITEGTGTYAQITFPYKTLATRGKVSRKLQAVGRTYADTLALELQGKVEDFTAELESACIIGNTAATAAQINGFLTMIQGAPQGAQDTDQNVHNITANLDLSKLDEVIDSVKGSGVRSDLMIVGSFAGVRKLNAVLQANQRFNDTVEVGAGFRVRTYDGIPLIVSTGMPNVLQLHASGQVINTTGGAQTALMVLNKRYCYMAELTPTTVVPLSKTSSQFDQFDILWDGHPVISNRYGAAMLVGLTI